MFYNIAIKIRMAQKVRNHSQIAYSHGKGTRSAESGQFGGSCKGKGLVGLLWSEVGVEAVGILDFAVVC